MKVFAFQIVLSIVFILTQSSAVAQLDWAQSFGSEFTEVVEAIAVDEDGNSYITGVFGGTVDFDPSDAEFFLTSVGYNTFVSKFNSLGEFQWAQPLLSIGSNNPADIAVNANGRLFITGSFSNTADFDPDSNSTFEVTSLGSADLYIWVLNTDGDFVTVRAGGSSQSDTGRSVVCDDQGNSYFTGHFYDTAVISGPSLSTTAVGSDGLRDFYVIKMNSDLDFDWEVEVGGQNSEDMVSEIALDGQGNVLVAGTFTGTVPFNSDNDFWTFQSNGFEDIFIYKLTTDGGFVWTKTFGGALPDNCNGLVIDDAYNSYATGFFQAEVDFDPNENEELLFTGLFEAGRRTFVQKLTSEGDFLWAKMLDGTGNNQTYDMDIDSQNNLSLVGQFSNLIDFDPNGGSQDVESEGGTVDGFFLQLNESGNWISSYAYHGDAVERLRGVSLNLDDSIYITGEYEGEIDLDPSNNTLNSATFGMWDVFISKLNACQPSFSIESVSACDSFEWINGTTYTSSTDQPTYYVPGGNILGCDSLVTLNLTISTIDTEVNEIDGVLVSEETGSAYQWLDCENNFAPIEGADEQSFVPNSNGNYAVEITNGPCSAISDCISYVVDNITETNVAHLTIQPTFGDGQFSVISDETVSCSVSVYSVYGQLVFTQNYPASYAVQCRFDGAPGKYIVHVQSSKGVRQMGYVVVR